MDISMLTWLKASFVLLVAAIMGGAIGWGFGKDHGAKHKKSLDRIHAILDVEGEEWDSETIELVAEVIREAGYVIHDPNDPSIAD
jgi:hypothetical protein